MTRVLAVIAAVRRGSDVAGADGRERGGSSSSKRRRGEEEEEEEDMPDGFLQVRCKSRARLRYWLLYYYSAVCVAERGTVFVRQGIAPQPFPDRCDSSFSPRVVRSRLRKDGSLRGSPTRFLLLS